MSLLVTLNRFHIFFGVSIVEIEQANADGSVQNLSLEFAVSQKFFRRDLRQRFKLDTALYIVFQSHNQYQNPD